MNPSPPPHRTIVVKVGGSLLDDQVARLDFLSRVAVAAIDEARPIVLVHGGGSAVDRHLHRIGAETERIDGIRITPAILMPEIAAVLAGRVGTMLVADLRRLGVAAVGLRVGDDDGIVVSPFVADFDPGAVGTVTGGRAALLTSILAAGRTPVLASIGFLPDGDPVNINADDAAAGVAAAVDAGALLMLTDVPGVMDAGGRTIAQLDAERMASLIEDGTIHGGMIPKVRSALAAAEASGTPVVIAHWSDEEVLVDPFAALHATTIRPTATGVPG